MNKLFIAAFLLVAALPMRGQNPPPSFPSAADTFAGQPATPTPSPSSDQKIDPLKAQLIRQVLTHSKEAEQAQQRILQAIAGMKLMMPRVGAKFWDKYEHLISLDELRDRLVPVYDKHFTTEDLNELLKFYDSPVGKKLSENAVPILRESMEISQELSKRAAQSVAADVQAEQLLQMPQPRSRPSPIFAPKSSGESPAPSATATPTSP